MRACVHLSLSLSLSLSLWKFSILFFFSDEMADQILAEKLQKREVEAQGTFRRWKHCSREAT